jgi:hypothetical protein
VYAASPPGLSSPELPANEVTQVLPVKHIQIHHCDAFLAHCYAFMTINRNPRRRHIWCGFPVWFLYEPKTTLPPARRQRRSVPAADPIALPHRPHAPRRSRSSRTALARNPQPARCLPRAQLQPPALPAMHGAQWRWLIPASIGRRWQFRRIVRMYYSGCVDVFWLWCRSFRLPNLRQTCQQLQFLSAATAASIARA